MTAVFTNYPVGKLVVYTSLLIYYNTKFWFCPYFSEIFLKYVVNIQMKIVVWRCNAVRRKRRTLRLKHIIVGQGGFQRAVLVSFGNGFVHPQSFHSV